MFWMWNIDIYSMAKSTSTSNAPIHQALQLTSITDFCNYLSTPFYLISQFLYDFCMFSSIESYATIFEDCFRFESCLLMNTVLIWTMKTLHAYDYIIACLYVLLILTDSKEQKVSIFLKEFRQLLQPTIWYNFTFAIYHAHARDHVLNK